MKKFLHLAAALCALAPAVSCGGDLDYLGMFWTLSETANERFSQSMAYNSGHEIADIHVPAEDYTVYLMTDVHVDYTTDNLDAWVNAYLADCDAAPFCLCLGDIINATGHYQQFMDHIAPILNNPADTLFCIAGNHDIYYNQWSEYHKYFGTSTYAFTVVTPSGARDRFICLDSSSGTLGSRQMDWLREALKASEVANYRNLVVLTHTHFVKKDGSQGHTSNFPMQETYELLDLMGKYNVDLVISGHKHSRDLTTVKGVRYLIVDAMEDHYPNAFYAKMHFGDSIDWDFVPVGPQD